ncbi:hypothetical protein H6P81_003668 [Aristolochia fimbriata]|uniref:Uncharacterized protein n=1 Tax=Aristolochia fimbriata TaxID=158543 RepID=A0AAV7FG75_ARIFI|nr:hypothetical protein H6P81_003668 [Aristolochia fimbriata]
MGAVSRKATPSLQGPTSPVWFIHEEYYYPLSSSMVKGGEKYCIICFLFLPPLMDNGSRCFCNFKIWGGWAAIGGKHIRNAKERNKCEVGTGWERKKEEMTCCTGHSSTTTRSGGSGGRSLQIKKRFMVPSFGKLRLPFLELGRIKVCSRKTELDASAESTQHQVFAPGGLSYNPRDREVGIASVASSTLVTSDVKELSRAN